MMSDKVRESIENALAELYHEKQRIDKAVGELEALLENLTSSVQRLSPHRTPAGKPKRSTAGWTPEARRAAAERMKRYWAERRRAGDDTPDNEMMPGKEGSDSGPKKRSTKGWTPEARQAAAERMKKYWENQRGNDPGSADQEPQREAS